MPVEVHGRPSATSTPRDRRSSDASGTIVVGLVNNMPDPVLEATEGQFVRLLTAAAGSRRVILRFTHLPEIPRGALAREALEHRYWPLEEMLSDPPDGLIVTGTEPRASSLRDEPYWKRLIEVLAWADSHTASSIWSCLAAHAAVLHLDGVERRRLARKLSGVFTHSIVDHPLTTGVSAPLETPHSRWNDLAPRELEVAGYQLLSESPQSGANAFVKRRRSLLVFFQGHLEYEARTLLEEYRRDVRRFLDGRQDRYPYLPKGYFPADTTALLQAFEAGAISDPNAVRPEAFPFEMAATRVVDSWRRAAVQIYENWLSFVATSRSGASSVGRGALVPAARARATR